MINGKGYVKQGWKVQGVNRPMLRGRRWKIILKNKYEFGEQRYEIKKKKKKNILIM